MMASQHTWRRWSSAALLVLLAVAAAGIQPAASKRLLQTNTLKQLAVLGDDFSDAGDCTCAPYSFFKQTGKPDPKYYPSGRFSGGPVWTDYVNKCLNGGVRSYAVGYGTVRKEYGYPTIYPTFPSVPVLDIEAQVAAYIKLDLLKQTPANRATLLWAGVNDILVAFKNDPDGPTGPLPCYLDANTDLVLNAIVDGIILNINNLIAKGEQNIIVLNVLPLELSVYIRNLDVKVPGLAVKIGGYINLLNARLKLRIAGLKLAVGVRVDLLDIYTPIKLALTGVTPVAGITDLVKPCLLNIDADINLLGLINLNLGVSLCSNPLAHACYDDLIHLNTVIHKEVIAKVVIDFLIAKGYISACISL
jgi:hypothetical protein